MLKECSCGREMTIGDPSCSRCDNEATCTADYKPYCYNCLVEYLEEQYSEDGVEETGVCIDCNKEEEDCDCEHLCDDCKLPESECECNLCDNCGCIDCGSEGDCCQEVGSCDCDCND